jgi:hypothetical protein
MIKGILLALVILIIAFFIFRGVMLWYWKINEIVTKLDLILSELRKLSERSLIK